MKKKFPFRDHGFEKLACSVTENVCSIGESGLYSGRDTPVILI
jgi:hypothetical protein